MQVYFLCKISPINEVDVSARFCLCQYKVFPYINEFDVNFIPFILKNSIVHLMSTSIFM